MLVPATAEDLKKHGQISISAKTDDANADLLKDPLQDEPAAKPDGGGGGSAGSVGSTVQIKIPVVATVVQRRGKDGNVCMAVQSPGPASEGPGGGSCVFTTTGEDVQMADGLMEMEELKPEAGGVMQALLPETQIEFIDESGNVIPEDDFHRASRYFQQSFPFATDQFGQQPLEVEGLNLQENRENIPPSMLREIDAENILNMDSSSNLQIFKMLEKSQGLELEEQGQGQQADMLYGHLEAADYVFN